MPVPPILLSSLAPVIAPGCRVLVLGSMPGARSLALQQYYGHPHNRFWRTMEALCGVDPQLPYRQRVQQLTAAGIALWDTLARCERSGSLDSAIRRDSEVPNAIAELLAAQPTLRTLALNGGKAAQVFRRHLVPQLPAALLAQFKLIELPSTSPTNRSMTEADQLTRWLQLGSDLQPLRARSFIT